MTVPDVRTFTTRASMYRIGYTASRGASGRGESHPPALSDPGVSLSAHRAPIIQPMAAQGSPSGQTGSALVF